MKLKQILIAFFLLISSMIYAQTPEQDSLIQYYNKFPKQAIKDADSLYQQAIKEDNHVLLIKSLILKTSSRIEINQDEYPRMIKELEAYITKSTNIQVKSILHSYLGKLYETYYESNRYKIEERSEFKGDIPDDINTWSSNIFWNKINEHLLASIASKTNLQQTPISDFESILIIGKSSERLRPTLFDFLCHRAIEIFSDLRFSDIVENETLDNAPEILSTIDTFLSYDIPRTQLSPNANAFRVWQELLRFRKLRSDSNIEALLFADLERLEYAHKMSSLPVSNSLYLQTLSDMQKQYKENPMVVEIMAKEAYFLIAYSYKIYYLTPSDQKQATKLNKERALIICEKGIQKYPQYHRINILKAIIQTIRTPEINIEHPRNIYPKDILSLKIKSCNLTSAKIFIYQIHTNTLDYMTKGEKGKNDIPKTLVYQNNPTLVYDLINQDTIISIPIEQAGIYEVVVKVPNAKEDIKSTFICSELFSTYFSTSKGFRFRVYDWQSGKTIPKAKIFIYEGFRNYRLIDSVYTNIHGFTYYAPKDSSNDYYYEVVNSNNPNGPLISTFQNYPSNKKKSAIITDRKVYRPGQRVEFKVYAWEEVIGSAHTLSNKQYDIIFKDANHKEIDRLQLTTNKFGTSSGSFLIPQHTLNGRFSILMGNNRSNIQVVNYKRPKFEIILSQAKQHYQAGDTISIKGEVKSFSGSTISNTTVKYTISNFLRYSYNGASTIQGTTQTNANGEFELSFKTIDQKDNPQKKSPLHYSSQVTVKVTDSNGETQEYEIKIPIYTGKATTSINIPEQVNKNKITPFYISVRNSPSYTDSTKIEYSIDRIALSDKIMPKKYYFSDSYLSAVTIAKHISKGELYIQKRDSIFPKLTHLPSGKYLFTLSCDNNITKRVFYLYSSNDKQPPIPTYEWIVVENDECRIGDTARILLGTSAIDTYVDIDIYNNRSTKIGSKTLLLSNEITPIEIPYLSSYGKQIILNISYVKDKQFISKSIVIRRKRSNSKLNIQTTVFRDKLQAGQKEEWKIKVKTDNNKTSPIELLAMMYDASLDKITPYNPKIQLNYLRRRLNFERAAFSITDHYWKRIYDFKHKQVSFPAFRFDQLNLFSRYFDYSYEMTGESNISEFGDKDEDIFLYTEEESSLMSSNGDIGLRKTFQETAFFYPQLQTDSTGTVTFSFKVPDALTKWKFIAIANTPDMAIGQIERYVTTSKPLMVRPNMPRFFRSGDKASLKVTISNLSDTIQKGIATIEFLTVSDEQIIHKQQHNFDVAAKQKQTVDFNFDVPENMEFTLCRITAVSGNFSDGEQHLIPILPNETLVTETLPIYTTSAGKHTYSFDKDRGSKENYRLIFELTSNPIWYAVLALPSLAEPTNNNVTEVAASYYVNSVAANIARSNPRIIESIRNWNAKKDDINLSSKLEQNRELKSILLEASPWVMQAQNESERMQSLNQLFDKNRLKYLQTQALKKLANLQTRSGGWSWFKGMHPSRFMTLNVLTILHRTSLIAQVQYGEKEKRMQIRALHYLDNQIKKDFKDPQRRIDYDQIIYLYTRSLYRDIPLNDALDAHKHLISLALKQWSNFSLYEKALTAIAMKNYGFTKEAQDILKSIRQYAIIDSEQGMYWANNRNRYYRNSAVLEHTAIMEAFQEIEGNSQDFNLMKQWLLRQKQVQAWESVPSTVNAIYALLLTGDDQLSSTSPINVKLGKHIFNTDSDKNPLEYIKKSYQAESIKQNMLSVKIKKESNTPSWGGMYLQYFEKLDQVKEQKTDISVNKELFIAKMGTNGKQEITPIDKQKLTIGSKVIIRLTISLKSDMEFLHLKDLRAACFEPIKQLSGIHWNFSSVYYQDVKDAATNFFFNSLARGTYIIEYPVWINQSGTYQGGIATFQSIYSPKFNAFSSATKIEIK